MTSYVITSDLKGRKSGSNIENPNSTWQTGNTTVQLPPGFVTERSDSSIALAMNLDGSVMDTTVLTNGGIAQALFKFDIVSILERSIGSWIWQGKTLLSDKLTLAKKYVTNTNVQWWGMGSSVGGNKATIRLLHTDNTWRDWNIYSTSGSIQKLLLTVGDVADLSYFQNDGFLYLIAYAEPSDGVTPSVITTDYVNIVMNVQIDDTVTGQLSKKNLGKFLNTDLLPTHTDQTYNGATGGYGVGYISCDGYDKISLITKNDSTTSCSASIDWSFDGILANANEVVNSMNGVSTKTGTIDIKAPYFRVFVYNGDSGTHTVNNWAYLKTKKER